LRRIGLFIILSIFFVAGCNRQTKEGLYQEGLTLTSSGNYRGAVVLFKNALEKDPNYFEARFQLANAYMETGKFDKAENEFEKVRLQNPSYPDIALSFASLYIRTNRPDKALEMVATYLNSHEPNSEALEIAGQASYLKGNLEEAEKSFREAAVLDDQNIKPKLLLAQVLIKKGRTDVAKDILTTLVDKKVRNKAAYIMLARLEASEGALARSRDLYVQWSQIAPSDMDALFMIGLLDLNLGEMANGEAMAEQLIKRYPKNGRGMLLKGIAGYLKGDDEKAATDLQLSLKSENDPLAFYFLGLAYHRQELYELALNQFQKVLDFNPDSVQARVMVAMTLLKQKRTDDAIGQVRIALDKYPDNGLAHNILGSAYMAQGKYDAAMDEFNRAITLDPNLADVHVKKGLFNLSQGDTGKAEEEMVTAVRISPEVLDTRLILANHYIRQQNYEKAQDVLLAGLSGKPQDAVIYNTLAGVSLAQKNIDNAIEMLAKAKRMSPDYFTPYLNLASIYLSRGDYAAAISEYDEILKQDPKQTKTLLALGMTLEMKGDEASARDVFNRAASVGDVPGAVGFADYLMKKGAFDKALDVLDEARKNNPDNGLVLELQSRLLLKLGRINEASAILERVEALYPGKGYPLLVQAYLHFHQPDKARALADNLIQTKPASPYGYLLLTTIFENGGDLQAALQTLQRIPSGDEGATLVPIRKAQIHEKMGQYDKAMTLYKNLLNEKPHFYPALFAQGALEDKLGNKSAALVHYKKVLQEEPNYTPALNNLAYLQADNYGDPGEALDLALKAFRNAPDDPGILDTLGYVMVKNNRVHDGIRLLEKAAAILPDNPTVCYHLALAYSAAGKKGEAVALLKKAKQFGAFPEAEKTESLLKQLTG